MTVDNEHRLAREIEVYEITCAGTSDRFITSTRRADHIAASIL